MSENTCDYKDCDKPIVQITTPGGFHFCEEHRIEN